MCDVPNRHRQDVPTTSQLFKPQERMLIRLPFKLRLRSPFSFLQITGTVWVPFRHPHRPSRIFPRLNARPLSSLSTFWLPQPSASLPPTPLVSSPHGAGGSTPIHLISGLFKIPRSFHFLPQPNTNAVAPLHEIPQLPRGFHNADSRPSSGAPFPMRTERSTRLRAVVVPMDTLAHCLPLGASPLIEDI